MTDKKFPDVPKESIIRPEDGKPAKTDVGTEEVVRRDEAEDKQLKSDDLDTGQRR
jgi:hypothetical protein